MGPLHLGRRIRIHTQAPAPTTRLASVPFTSSSAATIRELSGRAQRVPAEALAAVFSARHAVAGFRAVGYALCVGDGADVRECDARKNAAAVRIAVVETAAVGPAGCDGRAGRAGGRWAAA